MRRVIYLLGVLICLALSGCRENKTVDYGELRSGDVLVEVNGVSLTKAKLERDVKFRLALEAHRNPQMTVAAARKLERGLYAQGVDYFRMRRAYMEEARERGIAVGPEDLETARTRFLKRYTRNRAARWDAFLKDFDPSLAEGLDEELRFEALRIRLDAELRNLPVGPMPAEELDRLYAARTAFGERQGATNALIYATATNLWRKIVSTRSEAAFTKIGRELAERDGHVLFDEQYGPYDAEYFRDSPELVALLPELRVNGVTPPVENDNGLAILKLQAIDRNAPYSTTPRQPQYVFSRIFFELPELVEPCTREEFREAVARERREKMPSTVVDARVKAQRVAYPNGKVVFGN